MVKKIFTILRCKFVFIWTFVCSLDVYKQVQVQVQNFIQKTFSGYTQVAYEKKEEQ